MELNSIGLRLEENAELIEHFFAEDKSAQRVRWIEMVLLQNATNITLVDANLDVSSYLDKHLFSRQKAVSLCSATMTTNQDFKYIRQSLGITSDPLLRTVTEKIYDSPFDYEKRTLLIVPTDIPYPSDPSFISVASERIFQALQASQGNAFVFCSPLMTCLRTVIRGSWRWPKGLPFHFLKQGDASRQALIEKFKKGRQRPFWHGLLLGREWM